MIATGTEIINFSLFRCPSITMHRTYSGHRIADCARREGTSCDFNLGERGPRGRRVRTRCGGLWPWTSRRYVGQPSIWSGLAAMLGNGNTSWGEDGRAPDTGLFETWAPGAVGECPNNMPYVAAAPGRASPPNRAGACWTLVCVLRRHGRTRSSRPRLRSCSARPTQSPVPNCSLPVAATPRAPAPKPSLRPPRTLTRPPDICHSES